MKNNRFELIILLIILAVAAFFRFYDIPGYMTFLGDEGRDALIVKKLLVESDLPFIGPPTSVGNIYLGPLYYYMMAAPMAIFWLNPAAAAYQVAIIGVLVVFLIYYLSREWFGRLPAAGTSFLYAISPVTIIYSKSSWNPNPTPFFSLIAILGLYKAHKSGNFLWFILTGGALAAALQMHYLALILLPIVAILWLYELSLNLRRKLKRSYFWFGTLGAILAFIILMSPLVIFDFKHNFLNYRALKELFASGVVGLDFLNLLARSFSIYKDNLIGRFIAGEQNLLSWLLAAVTIMPLIYAIYLKWKGKVLEWPYLMLGVYLIVGLLGLTFYKQSIYDHYLGFLNPAPYLLLGALFSIVSTSDVVSNLGQFTHPKWLVKVLIALVVVGLTLVNLQKNPLQYSPNNQLVRTQEIAKFVIVESSNKPFNFALLAQNNYDAAYQFYLDLYGHKPKQVPFNITDQLFVVCEDAICHPIGHPKYEIAGFGLAKIESEKEILGVKVYKLIANPTGEPPK